MSHPELPPELVAAIKDEEYACVSAPTDHGTVFVMKAPRRDIEGLRGPLPILVRHELYDHPASPVIRTLFTLYDRLHSPLTFESFINVGDPQQREDFAALAKQPGLELLFYDEHLAHRLSKQVSHRRPETVAEVLAEADRLYQAIRVGQADFDRAKGDLIRNLPWPPLP